MFTIEQLEALSAEDLYNTLINMAKRSLKTGRKVRFLKGTRHEILTHGIEHFHKATKLIHGDHKECTRLFMLAGAMIGIGDPDHKSQEGKWLKTMDDTETGINNLN